jgi:hypothetical protein
MSKKPEREFQELRNREIALQQFYALQEQERLELLPRDSQPRASAAALKRHWRNLWPYSSLIDPTGDFTEAENAAMYGGTDHQWALEDPNYLCECSNCPARRAAHTHSIVCAECAERNSASRLGNLSLPTSCGSLTPR